MPIVVGDTPSFTITLLNQEGGPLNLTSHTVTVTFKARVTDADEAALFQHFIRFDGTGAVLAFNGMVLGPAGITGGVIIETLSIAESEALTPQSCKGDVEVRYGTQVHTPILGISEKIVAGYTNAAPV